MSEVFRAEKITDHVWWVGAIDWGVRNFHGYLTSRGTTYNAYLIQADKLTLVDTVKAPFFDEMMARISSVVEPDKIDYIISNHAEMDHSGALPATIDAVGPEKVFASKMGAKALNEHFAIGERITAVGDGDSLDLGGVNATFLETKMCHWPDSMVTYLHEDKLLLSQDAFGEHLASYERFADQLDRDVVDYEAKKYYANILMPLSKFIKRSLQKVQESGVKLDAVAPDHGPIWRGEDINRIVSAYAGWAERKTADKAVIIYDTMWNSTNLMARAIAEGIAAEGTETVLMPTRSCHRSDIATEVLDAAALLVGSPTINNEIFPTVADAMCYLRGLRPEGLVGASFGSYGWGGEAPQILQQMLEDMRVDIVDDALKVKYVPTDDDLVACRELGKKAAEKIKQKLSE